jgi:hypothetical protein
MDFQTYSTDANDKATTMVAVGGKLMMFVGLLIIGIVLTSPALLEWVYAYETMLHLQRDPQDGTVTPAEEWIAFVGASAFVVVSIAWFHYPLSRMQGLTRGFGVLLFALALIVIVTFAQAALVALNSLPRTGSTGPNAGATGSLRDFIMGISTIMRSVFLVLAAITAAFGVSVVLQAVNGIWTSLRLLRHGNRLSANTIEMARLNDTELPDELDLAKKNEDKFVHSVASRIRSETQGLVRYSTGTAAKTAAAIIAQELMAFGPTGEKDDEIEQIAETTIAPLRIDLSLLPTRFDALAEEAQYELTAHIEYLTDLANVDRIRNELRAAIV